MIIIPIRKLNHRDHSFDILKQLLRLLTQATFADLKHMVSKIPNAVNPETEQDIIETREVVSYITFECRVVTH